MLQGYVNFAGALRPHVVDQIAKAALKTAQGGLRVTGCNPTTTS